MRNWLVWTKATWAWKAWKLTFQQTTSSKLWSGKVGNGIASKVKLRNVAPGCHSCCRQLWIVGMKFPSKPLRWKLPWVWHTATTFPAAWKMLVVWSKLPLLCSMWMWSASGWSCMGGVAAFAWFTFWPPSRSCSTAANFWVKSSWAVWAWSPSSPRRQPTPWWGLPCWPATWAAQSK